MPCLIVKIVIDAFQIANWLIYGQIQLCTIKIQFFHCAILNSGMTLVLCDQFN